MGDVEHHTFGEKKVNYDDPEDPLVRRLIELQSSECNFDRELYDWHKRLQSPRSEILTSLGIVAQHNSQKGPTGKSHPEAKIVSFQPKSVIETTGASTHHQAAQLLNHSSAEPKSTPEKPESSLNNITALPWVKSHQSREI